MPNCKKAILARRADCRIGTTNAVLKPVLKRTGREGESYRSVEEGKNSRVFRRALPAASTGWSQDFARLHHHLLRSLVRLQSGTHDRGVVGIEFRVR